MTKEGRDERKNERTEDREQRQRMERREDREEDKGERTGGEERWMWPLTGFNFSPGLNVNLQTKQYS